MLSRVVGVAAGVVALGLALPTGVAGQGASRSPVDDLLDRVTADINDLRYVDAIVRGRALAQQADAMAVPQRVRLQLLMAAAFFPDERAQQRGDSALAHLRAAVRLAPDVRFAAELRWRGLDSLLETARARTVAAVLRAPEEQRSGGPGSAASVELVAHRPMRLALRVVDRATGRTVRRDTATAERVRIDLPAHDGSRLLLAAGEYDLILVAHEIGRPDSVAAVHALSVDGTPPLLEPEPDLPAATLRPEYRAPNRTGVLATGFAFSGATIVLATLGRSDAALRDGFSPDARAYAVGGAILLGTAVVAWRDRGRPVPRNVAANADIRADHARRVEAVRATNRTRLEGYRATVRIAAEGR